MFLLKRRHDLVTPRGPGAAVTRSGLLTIRMECEHPDRARVRADEAFIDHDGVLVVRHHNAYVRSGLRNSLLREFALGGSGVSHIGLSSSSSAVTGDTRFLNGASGGAAANTIIKPINPAASIVADGAGVVQIVTAGATFQPADFTAGVFIVNKVGLLLGATDSDGNLIDVVGGAGGTAPYDKTFGFNYTAVGNFTEVVQLAVTASAA